MMKRGQDEEAGSVVVEDDDKKSRPVYPFDGCPQTILRVLDEEEGVRPSRYVRSVEIPDADGGDPGEMAAAAEVAFDEQVTELAETLGRSEPQVRRCLQLLRRGYIAPKSSPEESGLHRIDVYEVMAMRAKVPDTFDEGGVGVVVWGRADSEDCLEIHDSAPEHYHSYVRQLAIEDVLEEHLKARRDVQRAFARQHRTGRRLQKLVQKFGVRRSRAGMKKATAVNLAAQA